jgi:hypothetical protein
MIKKIFYTDAEGKMCRMAPAIHDEVIRRRDCHMVMVSKRAYKGYVHVAEDSMKNNIDSDCRIVLALHCNKIVKTSVS